MKELTWTCHICGEERPDSKISVWKSWRTLGTIQMQQNVRYCNDRPACASAAPTFSFFEKDEA